MYRVVLAAGLLMPASAADAKTDKRLEQALALTPEHFEQTAEIKDDSLETVATIDTHNGFQVKRGLMKIVWDDNFLRAFVDKTTGTTAFQVYQSIPYSGSLRSYETVNYETPNGPQSEPVTVIDRHVDGCSRYGCSYTEVIGFDVNESLLRTIAAAYQPGVAEGWRFKFKSRSGQDWQDAILPAEIAGLLAAVDAYKSSHHLDKAASSPPNEQ